MRSSSNLVVTFIMLAACSAQPKRQTTAIVVSIAPHNQPKFHSDEVVVTARSVGGVVGSKSIATADLNCRVGDTVRGVTQGIVLTLEDRACER